MSERKAVSRTEIMQLLRQVRRSLSQMRRALGRVNRMARTLKMMGMETGLAFKMPPEFFVIMTIITMITPIVQAIAERIVYDRFEHERKERERREQEQRRQWITEIERERRSSYRGVVTH